MVAAPSDNADRDDVARRWRRLRHAARMPEAGEGKLALRPVGAGREGRGEIMPGPPVGAGADMDEIGLAIAARADPHPGQPGAAVGKPREADAGAELDEAAIVGGADIAGHLGEGGAVGIAPEAKLALRDAAHHPVGDETPVGSLVRCHQKSQTVIRKHSAAAGRQGEKPGRRHADDAERCRDTLQLARKPRSGWRRIDHGQEMGRRGSAVKPCQRLRRCSKVVG